MYRALAIAAVYWVGIYAIALKTLPAGGYDFDAKKEPRAFEPHAARYQDLAKLLITLATASVGYLANFLATLPAKDRSPYSFRLEAATPTTITMLSLSVVLGLLFMLFQTYWYEEYVHRDRRSYNRYKYSTNVAIGWTSLLCFMTAFGWLAMKLFGVL